MTGNENENENEHGHGHGHGHETTLAPELYSEGAEQHQLQSGEGEEEAERGMVDGDVASAEGPAVETGMTEMAVHDTDTTTDDT